MQAGIDLGTARDDQETQMKQYLKSNKQAPPPEANLRPKQRAPISQVLLVGGGTRMPAVRRFVQNMTGLQPATFVQPDEVCLGLCSTVFCCAPQDPCTISSHDVESMRLDVCCQAPCAKHDWLAACHLCTAS